jgi:hypothetical protein
MLMRFLYSQDLLFDPNELKERIKRVLLPVPNSAGTACGGNDESGRAVQLLTGHSIFSEWWMSSLLSMIEWKFNHGIGHHHSVVNTEELAKFVKYLYRDF